MASIVLRKLGGMAPSANPTAIAESQAVMVRNLNLRFGDFRPLPAPAAIAGVYTAGNSLYRFESTDQFITRAGVVNFVRGPIPNNTTERTYYTGDGLPKVVDNTGAVRQLGVPQPGVAPVPTVVSAAPIFSEEDANTARVGKLGEIYDAVRQNLDKPYFGITEPELGQSPFTGRFTGSGTSPIDCFFNIPSTRSASGNLVATNPAHNNLNDWRIGYELKADGSGAYATIRVRAEGAAVGAGLVAALRAIKRPNGSNEPLLSAELANSFAAAVGDGIAVADKTRDECITRMKASLAEFVKIADSGDMGTAAGRGEVEAFYAKPEIVKLVDAGITNAVSEIISAMRGYTGGNGLSLPITGTP